MLTVAMISAVPVVLWSVWVTIIFFLSPSESKRIFFLRSINRGHPCTLQFCRELIQFWNLIYCKLGLILSMNIDFVSFFLIFQMIIVSEI